MSDQISKPLTKGKMHKGGVNREAPKTRPEPPSPQKPIKKEND